LADKSTATVGFKPKAEIADLLVFILNKKKTKQRNMENSKLIYLNEERIRKIWHDEQ
jgi:hypothetical protein